MCDVVYAHQQVLTAAILWVLQLLREKVKKCYLVEGVNQLQNCKPLVEDYLESIKGLGMARLNSGRYDNPPPAHPLA